MKSMDFDEALEQGLVKWIDDSCLERYYDAVLARGVTNLSAEEIAGAPLKLVYTPLNGTGLIPVTTVLERAGITDVTVVPEQKEPNGDFPTCPYPNPEIRQAMQKGIDLCEQVHPDLLLATDPDADRVGVAVKNGDDYLLLTGNEMGVLIGKRGQTLDSLQYLTNLAINKHSETYTRVKLDTEDYRKRRKETLENLARNIAYKVKRTKKAVSLEPMNPFERRVIHSALQNDRYVSTHSEGDEPYRHVVITLKRQ